MRKTVHIPSITVDPSVVFFEDERPEDFAAYEAQRAAAKQAWRSILEDPSSLFQACRFTVPNSHGQTLILAPSTREGVDWQLSFFDADGTAVMHEDYYANDSTSPNRSKHNNMDALMRRLTDYSLRGREITVEAEYTAKEREVMEQEQTIVKFQSAARSNFLGYVSLVQFDRDKSWEENDVKVFLGKSENYDGQGNYDNSDNSLVYISDNRHMDAFLSGTGWTESQQAMIDNGAFTAEDYAEYARLKEGVLKQFEPIRTREVRFGIDIYLPHSGIEFQYPTWEQPAETKTVIEKLEQRLQYCSESRIREPEHENEWRGRADEVNLAIETLRTQLEPMEVFAHRRSYCMNLANSMHNGGLDEQSEYWQGHFLEVRDLIEFLNKEESRTPGAIEAVREGHVPAEPVDVITMEVEPPVEEQAEESVINNFRREYSFLSNYYAADVEYNGVRYRNNEAAFQAQKAVNEETRALFEGLYPPEARRFGHSIELRPDWEEIKEQVMYEVCKAKFDQHPELTARLLATGNRPLEEGNAWNDRTWGTVNGVGENKLGKILMRIRDEAREVAREQEASREIPPQASADRTQNTAVAQDPLSFKQDPIPQRQRLFVDMDGTLAVFTPADTLEVLYEEGYFRNLAPHENVVESIREIITNHPDIEVYILSAYLTDSKYALQEKNAWLDEYLPELDAEHRVFVPCGSDKKDGIPGGIRTNDFLLDDYTKNLNDWQPPARGIKLLNAINHTRGTWAHDRIRYDRDPVSLANGIVSIMRDEQRIFDDRVTPDTDREGPANAAPERNDPANHDPNSLSFQAESGLEADQSNPIPKEGVDMNPTEKTFIEDLARYDFIHGASNWSDILPRFVQQASMDAASVYEAYGAEYNRLQAEAQAVVHIESDDAARLVVLTTDRIGERYSHHEIAYNSPMTPDELAEYKDDPDSFLESVYARLGNAGIQPSDYYGHSPSIGDAIAVLTSEGTEIHYVDRFGFTQDREADHALVMAHQNAAALGMTVRDDYNLLENINDYTRSSGDERLIDVMFDATADRLASLRDEYVSIFSLADIRGVVERNQEKLAVLYEHEDDYILGEPLAQYAGGRYTLTNAAVRGDIRGDIRVAPSERLAAEINNRFARIAQELSNEATVFYRHHASPRPLGEHGEHDFIVQAYEREEDGPGAIARNVIYAGNAAMAMELVNHLNAGTNYGDSFLENADLRRNLGMSIAMGDDADRAAIAIENETLEFESTRRAERVVEAMEAAGYHIDDEAELANLVFRTDYGNVVGFAGVHAVEEWLEGVVFDDPEISDAVERIMHPERFEPAPYEPTPLTADQQLTVNAMQAAGYVYDPRTHMGATGEIVFRGEGENDYPLSFNSWDEARTWIASATFSKTENGTQIREAVQNILQPDFDASAAQALVGKTFNYAGNLYDPAAFVEVTHVSDGIVSLQSLDDDSHYEVPVAYFMENINEPMTQDRSVSALTERLQNIAATAMEQQGSPWGSWFGRISYPDRPQDYIELDITGYSTRNSVIESATVVRDGNVVDSIVMPEISADDYQHDQNIGFAQRVLDAHLEHIEAFGLSDYQLYAPQDWGDHTLEEHYELLRNAGYDTMPNYDQYNALREESTRSVQNHEQPSLSSENSVEGAEEPLVDITDLAYDDEGYLHFTVHADGYGLEGRYRVYDPANGEDMELVSIDYGDQHPIIERQWDRIEDALYDHAYNRYNELVDEHFEHKDRLVQAMALADYIYNEQESASGHHVFDHETDGRTFVNLNEALRWLDGYMMLSDHPKEPQMERILYPEQYESPIGDKEWYYNDAETGRVLGVYYNQDSNAGGQFVHMNIPYELIREAARECGGNEERFFEYIEEHADTELVDIDTLDFKESVYHYKTNEPDFVRGDGNTMERLMALAEAAPVQENSNKVEPLHFEYISVEDTNTGWPTAGIQDYGYIEGYVRGYNVEFRHRETGELNYNSALFVPTTIEAYYQTRIDEWGDLGYDPFETERMGGWEPTGRAVFRGYGVEEYDFEEREEFIKTEGVAAEIEQMLRNNGYVLKDGFDPHNSFLDNVAPPDPERPLQNRDSLEEPSDSATADVHSSEDSDLGNAQHPAPQAITRVAIESTDDYTEPGFHKDLADSDIQNEDGSYGREVDYYRIVTVGENGRLTPLNDIVFYSADAAREAVNLSPDLELVNYDDLVKEVGANLTAASIARMQEREAQDTITFYVAESMEFPNMGEYHEGLTLQEAFEVYDSIPSERLNGDKGIGFTLHDGSEYDGNFGLLLGGELQEKVIKGIKHYKESPLVQKAISDCKHQLALRAEAARLPEKAERFRDLRAIDSSRVICLDVETTGFSFSNDEILQLSIINGAGEVLFNEYIKPEHVTEWPDAEEIHHISPEMVADLATMSAHKERLDAIFANAELIVGYNSNTFDLSFIRAAGFEIPESTKTFDVMKEHAPLNGEWDEKRSRFRWTKLAECAEHYGYNSDGAYHDSLEDVRATLFSYFALTDRVMERAGIQLPEADRTQAGAQPTLTMDSDNIRVDGHAGTWYVIDHETINGRELFLLESEQHGGEAASLIVDAHGELVMDDIWNGFDDYRDQLEAEQDREQTQGHDNDPMEPSLSSERPFIAHYYVIDDLQGRANANLQEFADLDEALTAYAALPSDKMKAMGIMNTNDFPGSLDFIQCHDGKDVLVTDYQQVAGWDNQEVDVAVRRITETHQMWELAANYSLEDIQKELDNRDPMEDPAENAEGLAKYSYYALSRAEYILQQQDPVLSERVDLGERAILAWEQANGLLSDAEARAVYTLIRNKDIPLSLLEARIREVLREGPESSHRDKVEPEQVAATQMRGDPEHYQFFYSPEQHDEMVAFQKETGWRVFWGSDSQNLNGDTWVVYRSVEDLPVWLRDYASEMEAISMVNSRGAAQEATRYIELGYTDEQIEDVTGWIMDAPDHAVDLLMSNDFTYNQFVMIRYGVIENLTPEQLTILANPELGDLQMEQVLEGFADGLTTEQVRTFADPNLDPDEMYEARTKLTADNEKDGERMAADEQVQPESVITDAAYRLDNDGYLYIQTIDGGYDYTLYDSQMEDLDGGQLDRPRLTFGQARTEILEMHQLQPDVIERVSDEEWQQLIERHDAQLEQVVAAARTDADAPALAPEESLSFEAEPAQDGQSEPTQGGVTPNTMEMNYSENESFVRLAERIDEYMYYNLADSYRQDVGTTLEQRSAYRAHLANVLENNEFAPLIDTFRHLVNEIGEMAKTDDYTSELNEARDILYSLEHMDEYQQYYDRILEGYSTAVLPIREFFDEDGLLIDGERIPLVKSQTPNFSDRGIVYHAVQNFERDNDFSYSQSVIDSDGQYLDKEFLYDGYNRYVGMSHAGDLAIQPYMERLNAMHDAQRSLPLFPLIAEVYYAHANGLNREQINFILDSVQGERTALDSMRMLRLALENGMSQDKVEILVGEQPSNQQQLIGFMANGGSIEDARALKGADIATYYIVSDSLKKGEINHEMAAGIVQTVNNIVNWNRSDFDSQFAANPNDVRARFAAMDTEFFAEYLTDAAVADKSITPTMIADVGAQFVEQRDTDSLKAFVESKGGFAAFAPAEEKVQEKPAPEQEGISVPEEKKDAKEQLQEQLEQGIRKVLDSDNFKNWLDTSKKMFLNNYSFNNAILVWLQKPDASYTMGFEQWKQYGRSVAKGGKSVKIFVPVIAYEKKEGDLWRMINGNLENQLKANPSLQQAVYRIGMSKMEITMNRSGLYGLRVNGQERGILPEKEMRDFLKNSVIGKVPMYYSVGNVFDVKDTVVPEFLWMKKGFTKDEVVKDANGKPIKNKRGETKIINTPERQARFQPDLDLSVPQQDPAKMAILYEALKAVSERNGIHVYEKARDDDETLKGGADGYFSRDFTEKDPKGFIVMPTDLDATRKVSVMLHEMSHSELHGDLTKLAERMGEEKIPRQMREVQAEAVAYLVGKNFGIETDTSSFQYLAAYTQGFELQALSKSIEVIYSECKQLTNELKAELALRGLNMDLSVKENGAMDKEAVQALTKSYIEYAVENSNRLAGIGKELPDLAQQHRGNDLAVAALVAQSLTVNQMKADVAEIINLAEELENADTLSAQTDCIAKIEAAKERIEAQREEFTELSTHFQEAVQSGQSLKDRFISDPVATIKDMGENMDYPQLAQLTTAQVQYLAKSEYVKKELAPLLRNDPQQFAEKACERAAQLDKVASKNGMFVEVTFCERWTDEPIVASGTLMHPKVADSIVREGEAQIRALRAEAEKTGDYFPYNKCQLMIYQADNGQIARTFNTRVDIGDGAQGSLVDHLKKIKGAGAHSITEEFEKASREKGAKDKIMFNDSQSTRELAAGEKETPAADRGMSHENWSREIDEAREAAKEAAQEDADKSQSQQVKPHHKKLSRD